MSLLTRLGRPEGSNQQVHIFASQVSEDSGVESYLLAKQRVHQRIIDEMTPDEQKVLLSGHQDRNQVEQIINGYIQQFAEEDPFAIPRGFRSQMTHDIVNDMLGLGPIESLHQDETVTEIMVNGPSQVFVERMGKLELTKVKFRDSDHLMHIVDRILAPLGRRIDESSPLVDARLEDGSRVNIIIPPLSLKGPCLTIRKFSKKPFTVENLIAFGTMDHKMAQFLRACVQARVNILVSGGTGSGKTTTLNVISSFIPEGERIVTIEDAAELRLQQRHVVTLESRPANIEGKGQITIRDLVRNALRMRPDRIIVGEVRSGEALDMLQAMNTGHDGSLTTAHANSPRDVLSRLETMVLMSGLDLPVRAIREQISSAIDLIIQQSRIRDGSRKITYITEVQRMEGNTITTQDLFRYVQTGLDENGKSVGRFVSTGLKPSFYDKFALCGIDLPDDFFEAENQEEGERY
jgi:pilus assembly protein CpaF